MTGTSKENNIVLERVPYIHYLLWFKKNENQALIDFGNKLNARALAIVSKLGLKV